MGMQIQDATGSGKGLKIDAANRLAARAVTIGNNQDATEREDSFNLNSGLVTLTDASVQGILYVKNNEARDLHVGAIVVILGPSTGGVSTDTARIQFIKNPTTGTLISTATAADTNSNRHFGSSKVLSVDAFKGDGSATVTDGSVHIESLVGPGSRAFFAIDEILTKGDSIAITYEPPDSNTSMKTMAAIVCHLSDPDE